MNFWKRYPADYQRKTARLTLAQHGAYGLLLDEVYTSEAPLPASYDDLFRICRAMDKAEQAAVRAVADLFFPVGEDGLRRNSRAEEEIAEAAPFIAAARENGRKGGRPKKPSGNPLGFDSVTQSATQSEPRPKAPHSSESSSLRSEDKTRKAAPWLTVEELQADGLPAEIAQAWIEHRRAKKAKLTALAWQGIKDEVAKAPGWTLEQAVRKAIARDWRAFEASWVAETGRATGSPAPRVSFREQDEERAAARIHETDGRALRQAARQQEAERRSG